MKKVIVSLLIAGLSVMTVSPSNASETFKTCKELNKVYKYGVGLEGAQNMVKDRKTGILNPRASKHDANKAVYAANKKKDRDKDGIACEK